mgnify:CR=1 FL=1
MAETNINAEKKAHTATGSATREIKGGESQVRSGFGRGNGSGRGGFSSGRGGGFGGSGRRGGFSGGFGRSREEVVGLRRRIRRIETEKKAWIPKTEIGKKVANGEIKTIDEILEKNIRIKDPEIVEKLLPNLGEEIIENKRVQRVTTNGRVMRFKVVVAVGDGDGHIGLGQGKAKEVPIAITQAVRAAKLNIKKINRGCGSWFCNCGKPHTVPITMIGNSGSVSVKLIPAAGGLGLVAGEVTKKVLALAGIKDMWSSSTGHTRTSLNLAQATIDALVKCTKIKK